MSLYIAIMYESNTKRDKPNNKKEVNWANKIGRKQIIRTVTERHYIIHLSTKQLHIKE